MNDIRTPDTADPIDATNASPREGDTRPAHAPTASDASERRDVGRVGPLQWRLFFIVALGLAPIAILGFVTLVRTAQAQREQVIAATENTASAVSAAIDSDVALAWASLDVLATSPRLANDDWDGFRAEASQLLAQRPHWANVVVSTPAGEQRLNVRVPAGQPMPRRVDAANVAAIAGTGQPRVGNVVFGPVIGGFAVAAGVPVLRNGKVAYVITAPMRPDAFRVLLDRQRIPDRGVISVLDAARTTIARSINHEQAVGKPASPSLIAMLESPAAHGSGITTTLEGVPVYTVFRRSALTGWTVAIGLPTSAIDAPVRRSYAALGTALALSLVVGLSAALLAGRAITRPMRELERASVAVSRGEIPPPPRTRLPEIRNAAAALIEAQIERERLLRSERHARVQEREARVLAENANRAKDEFLAMLGHELRNPLAAITNAAHLLELPKATAALQDEAKRIIRRQAQHLGRITEDLLDAGRVVMGKVTLTRAPHDFARIVTHVVDTLRGTGALSLHSVTLHADSVWVDADATRLEQIAGNLVGNAVKYTPEHGTIAVNVAREGADAVLRVRDDGVGIDADLLARVFDLFVQGPQTVERSQGGLGIGLTLVRRLAELHGGTVAAFSEGAGRGSEFVVRLPAIAAPDLVPARDGGGQAGARRRIVIVEDNDDVRRSLRQLLELAGHEVLEAVDGPGGVALIVRERPDVALVDIGLPGLDGHGVARAVRARIGDTARLVALSGYAPPAENAPSTFDAYLVKPVDPDRLDELLA